MLSHKLNPSDRALQEDARKKPSLIEGQGKVVLKAGSRLDIDMSGSLSEILKAIKPLQTGKMTRESIKNSPFAMIGHNHYHNDLKRLNTGNYLHLTSLEYQQLCELPGMIAGKEDAGVAAGLVAAHETQWNHDSFLTELPEHDHSHNNLTGLNTGDDYLHLTQTEYQLFLGLPTAIATKQSTSEKGQANGYASLDSAGKVPIAQLPNSIMEYKGTWNAATNSPALANGSGNTGDVYRVSVTGTQFGYQFNVGDYCIYNGSTWEKSDTTDSVASVDGRTGAVSLSDKYQPLDTDLTTIAGFTHSNRHVMVSNGSSWTRRALEEADLPSHTHTSLRVPDTRYDTTTTSDYPAALKVNFKNNSTIGLSGAGTYSTVLGVFGWNDSSGGAAHELAFGSNGIYSRIGIPGNEWGSFRRILTTADTPSAIGAAPAAHSHAWNDIASKPSTFAPASHGLVSSAHTVSGLTPGHVLKALSATTYGFAALTPSEIGASAIGTERSLSVTTAGWVTIATSATGRAYGEFHVYDSASGKHNFTKIIASTSYGMNNVSVIGGNRFSTRSIAHVRILKNSSDPIYGGAKLQVYCENPTFTLYVKQFLSQEFTNWKAWNNATPVAEGTPTGWAQDNTTYLQDITNPAFSFIGSTLRGNALSIINNASIGGGLTAAGYIRGDLLRTDSNIEFLNYAGTTFSTFAKRVISGTTALMDLQNIRDIIVNNDIYVGSDVIVQGLISSAMKMTTVTLETDEIKLMDDSTTINEVRMHIYRNLGQGRCVIKANQSQLCLAVSSENYGEIDAIKINRSSGLLGADIPYVDIDGIANVSHDLYVSNKITCNLLTIGGPIVGSSPAGHYFYNDSDSKTTLICGGSSYETSNGPSIVLRGNTHSLTAEQGCIKLIPGATANGHIRLEGYTHVAGNMRTAGILQLHNDVWIRNKNNSDWLAFISRDTGASEVGMVFRRVKKMITYGFPSGATQSEAGAMAGELWHRTSDNVLCMGV